MVSIIIPTHNEAENIGGLIDYLLKNCGAESLPQILVADGGSIDQTPEIARGRGAKVINVAQKNRAVQMNLAVQKASGEIIYFVHADTKPPVNFIRHIKSAINSKKQVGCFTSIFDWDHPFLRFCNFFSRLPFWFCRGGGQTLFVTKTLFNKLGGFNEDMILMEEYDFISRARKKSPFAIIRNNAVTSARDYRKNGAIRLQLIYSYIFFLYSTGASQEKMVSIVSKYVKKA